MKKYIKFYIVILITVVFGTVVLSDALKNFSYYANSVKTWGEVTERTYEDENKERYTMVITYSDANGNEYSFKKENIIEKLARYPLNQDVIVYYDEKNPEVADMETRNIYAMLVIVLVMYVILAGCIWIVMRGIKEDKRRKKLIANNYTIMAQLDRVSYTSGKNVRYIVHAIYKNGEEEYEFSSEKVRDNPEENIIKKKQGMVKVFVEENNYKNYLMDVDSFW